MNWKFNTKLQSLKSINICGTHFETQYIRKIAHNFDWPSLNMFNCSNWFYWFYLKWTVRPVIEPFSFPKSLHQSQRYNLLCTVVKGDQPIQVSISLFSYPLNSSPLFYTLLHSSPSLLHFFISNRFKNHYYYCQKRETKTKKLFSFKTNCFSLGTLLSFISFGFHFIEKTTNRLYNKIALKTDWMAKRWQKIDEWILTED